MNYRLEAGTLSHELVGLKEDAAIMAQHLSDPDPLEPSKERRQGKRGTVCGLPRGKPYRFLRSGF